MARHADTADKLTPQPAAGDGGDDGDHQSPSTESPADTVALVDIDETTEIAGERAEAARGRRRGRRWSPRSRRAPELRQSPVTLALTTGMVTVVALGVLAGWLGYEFIEQRRAQDQRSLFLQVARQGALNLTTIDWQHADADVSRILDSATGEFYDDFSKRSQPFIDVVKQAQSKSVGTITEAGLESVSGDSAEVLLAVSVNTSNSAAPQQDPRRWKMRITVQETGPDVAKVSNVVFVP